METIPVKKFADEFSSYTRAERRTQALTGIGSAGPASGQLDASASSFVLNDSDACANRKTIVIDDYSSAPSVFFDRSKSAGNWSRNQSRIMLDLSSLEES